MEQPQLHPQTQLHCKVCYAAGLHDQCHTHNTRGWDCPQLEHNVISGGWPLIRKLGRINTCPHLANTVCTNPNCFNGQDGVVRHPEYGHSIKYCPSAWPPGWEMGGEYEYMRYTGVNWSEFQLPQMDVPPPPPPVEQVPPPPPVMDDNELYDEDISEMSGIGPQAEENKIAEEMNFLQHMEDFVEAQELDEQRELHNIPREGLYGNVMKRIQKIQKKLGQIDAVHQKISEGITPQKNQEHLLDETLENSLREELSQLLRRAVSPPGV